MPMWLPVVVTVVIAVVSLAAQFYFKLVPDPNDIRRHLKQAGWLTLDFGLLIFQGYWLYHGAQGPITNERLTSVGIDGASLGFCAAMIVTRRLIVSRALRQQSDLIGGLIDRLGTNIDHVDRLITVAERYGDVLHVIARDTSLDPEVRETVRTLLNIRTTQPCGGALEVGKSADSE